MYTEDVINKYMYSSNFKSDIFVFPVVMETTYKSSVKRMICLFGVKF